MQKETFRNPPTVYRCAPFWSLNGKLGKINGTKLGVGQMEYSVVILPQMDIIRGKVLELLKEFASKGGRLSGFLARQV